MLDRVECSDCGTIMEIKDIIEGVIDEKKCKVILHRCEKCDKQVILIMYKSIKMPTVKEK